MGFELTQGAVFYIVMMLIIVFIGLAIVAKGNPLALLKQQQVGGLFEPGKFTATGSVNEHASLECGTSFFTLKLRDLGFEYGGKPGKNVNTLDFMIILNYDGVTFPGKDDTDNDVQRVKCTPEADQPYSTCPPQNINFQLSGVPTPTGNRTFHFTVWKWNPELKDAAQDRTNTLDKLLDTFSNYYVWSFEANLKIERECDKSNCENTNDKSACEDANGLCFWDPGSSITSTVGSCIICPASTNCHDFTADACTVCTFSKANCRVTGTFFKACEAVAP